MANWTKKISILGYDLLLIPVHLPHHWALGAVDVTQKTISYWDGKQIISPAFFKNVRCFLKEEIMRKGQCFNEGDWMDEIHKVVPVQENNYDCGMFASMFAEHLSGGRKHDFHQTDMPSLRRAMRQKLISKSL